MGKFLPYPRPHIYRENKSVYKKWSIDRDNEGNRFIINERRRVIIATLKKEGYFPFEDKKILDTGCGKGELLAKFLSWGAKPQNLYGVDISADRIEVAKRNYPQLKFQRINAEKLDFPDHFFDLILFFTVFSSIFDKAVIDNLSQEALRVLKTDGAIIVYDMRYPNPFNPNTRHITKEEIKRHFKKCYFEFKTLTLIPHLARLFAPLSFKICSILEKIPFLRSHYLIIIRKKL